MRKRVTILIAMTAILGGCQSKSISNSGYPGDASLTAANGNLADQSEVDDDALPLPEGSKTTDTSSPQ